jgi:FixJ family two-component response regulator
MSGLQLQHRLSASGTVLPLVFVVGKPDVSTAVELMRGGAVHVLEKLLRAVELLEAIQEALLLGQNRRHAKSEERRLKNLTAILSRKELEVLDLIAAGKSPKAIAAVLAFRSQKQEVLGCPLSSSWSLPRGRIDVTTANKNGRPQREAAAAG